MELNTERDLVYTEFFKGVLEQFVFPIRGGSCSLPQVSVQSSVIYISFCVHTRLLSERVKALRGFHWEGVGEEFALLTHH